MSHAWVVCDSDSYLKWGVARAEELTEAGFETSVMLIDNAVTPSAEQIAAALDGRAVALKRFTFAELTGHLAASSPDVLLLACRGPMLELVIDAVEAGEGRPVVAAGIPGIWLPPTMKGLRYRRGVDVLIVHSVREREAVGEMLPFGRAERIGLASLVKRHQVAPSRFRDHVVFAPQALVPSTADDRLRVLVALATAARAHPQTPIVIKLRGRDGEPQTHFEALPYTHIAESHRIDLPPNLTFEYGPLSAYLEGCRGLVTVSSTAVLEAHAAGVPVLCIDDFGVSTSNINVVFKGSGFMGSLAQVEALEFPQPDPEWLEQNYFQASVSNWANFSAYSAMC